MQVADELHAIKHRLHDTQQLSAGIDVKARDKQAGVECSLLTGEGQQANRQAPNAAATPLTQIGTGKQKESGLLGGLKVTGHLGKGSHGTVYSGAWLSESSDNTHC